MISKLRFQWNIIPSLKSVYSKPRKPQNEVYSTQGCSWMVLRHSTELASKYMVDIKGFDLNPWQHDALVWNSSTPNMRGKFDVAWKLSPKFYDICEVQFPADPCASSILATLPRLYRPLCTANWFSENPQQQKTKAAIWSLNHMEMFSEWHYNTDMSWHWKIWRKTKAFTWYRHCFFFPKYEIKIGSWENKLKVGISPGLAESVLRGIENHFLLEFYWKNASSSLTSLGHIASQNSRGLNFGKRPQHLKTQKHGNDGLARRHRFTSDVAKGDVL